VEIEIDFNAIYYRLAVNSTKGKSKTKTTTYQTNFVWASRIGHGVSKALKLYDADLYENEIDDEKEEHIEEKEANA